MSQQTSIVRMGTTPITSITATQRTVIILRASRRRLLARQSIPYAA
jgi:hypothetical protein